MSANTDEAKGRVKEAAGDLTGDQSLKNEGKVDRAAGKVKDEVGDGRRQGQGRPAQGLSDGPARGAGELSRPRLTAGGTSRPAGEPGRPCGLAGAAATP